MRKRLVDLAAILASWLFALVLIGESRAGGRISEDEVLPLFVLACLSALPIWWRRSHPVAAFTVALPFGLVTDAGGYAGMVLLYTLVTLRRGWIIPFLVVVSSLVSTVYIWRRPDPALPVLGEVVLGGALLAVTVAVGLAVRSRRELIASLRDRAARAEEEAQLRADRLRSLERERIAREMHDALAHRISMVSLHAGALQIRPDLTADEVAKAAATIRDSAHQALEDLREILGVLRAGENDGLRPQPDWDQLGDLLQDAADAGVRVDASILVDGATVAPSLGRTVYRLVQEGLTNAGKHAPGVPVRLLLEKTTEGELHVEVSNPLPGRPPPGVPGAGAGLVGLAERVELLGGRLAHGLRADPRAGLGFRLEAWLPWPS